MPAQPTINSRPAQRLLDLALALPALILTLPIFLIISLAIRFETVGPAIFRQQRVGQGARLFDILKFRTMTVAQDPSGSLLTIGADRRITRVGGWLRRYKLDELPQLINIVRGEMSLVGARP
ncbi:MAG: sugar transferase, partial [Acidobacteriota bacterium]